MKLKFIAAIAFACALLSTLGYGWLTSRRELARRAECLSTLRSTGAVLGLHCQEHKGKLPESFSLLSNLVATPSLYICPRQSKPCGSWTNITQWMDYLYVPWTEVTGACTNYPLLYDRRLANHGGKGIHILLVEQVVNTAIPTDPRTFHSQFFWDKDARWLRHFASEHPDLKIPMPEDLK